MNIVKVHLSPTQDGEIKSVYINLDNVCVIQRLPFSTKILFIDGWTILVDETPEEIAAKAN